MSDVYLSPLAGEALTEALKELGHRVLFTKPLAELSPDLACHADMLMCKLGCDTASPIVFADPSRLGPEYPLDAKYNGAALDKYFIHRLDITAPELLEAAKALGLRPINVRQGYTKCSCVLVDGSSLITADKGIADALKALEDVEVLSIRPGHVLLRGFDTGFIGGASGRVGNVLWFNGDLSAHPDFGAIRDFVVSRNVELKYFEGYPLEDIGSIIQAG